MSNNKTTNEHPEAKDPCHICDGTGVVGDYAFSTEVTTCAHCEGTGEEPLHLLPKRVKRRQS